jgi:hypothetical protein
MSHIMIWLLISLSLVVDFLCNVAKRERNAGILYFELLWTDRGSTVSFVTFQGFIKLK